MKLYTYLNEYQKEKELVCLVDKSFIQIFFLALGDFHTDCRTYLSETIYNADVMTVLEHCIVYMETEQKFAKMIRINVDNDELKFNENEFAN